MENDEPSTPAEPASNAPFWRRWGRKEWARMVALVGLLVILVASRLWIAPALPSTRVVEIEIGDPTSVTSVSMRWLQPDTREELVGAEMQFAPGECPARVVRSLSLQDGTFEVEIDVVRRERNNAVRRRVTLSDAERVTFPVP